MKKILITVLAAAGFIIAKGQNTDTLKNDAIIKMHQSGFSTDLILKRIQTAPLKNFDLSTDALILLKKESISDTVVLAMMNAVSPANGNIPSQQSARNDSREMLAEKDPDAPKEISDLTVEGIYYKNPETGIFNLLPMKNISPQDVTIRGYNGYRAGFVGKKAAYTLNEENPVFYVKLRRGDSPSMMSLQPTNLVLYRPQMTAVGRTVKFGTTILNTDKPIVEQMTNSVYKLSFKKAIGRGTYLIAPQQSVLYNCYEFDITSK
jgi:hypothetical protein